MVKLNYITESININQARYMLSLKTDFHPASKIHVIEPRFECLVGDGVYFNKYNELSDALKFTKNPRSSEEVYIIDCMPNKNGSHDIYLVK